MAPEYAEDMPAGFTNRIERVAVVGVSSFNNQCSNDPVSMSFDLSF